MPNAQLSCQGNCRVAYRACGPLSQENVAGYLIPTGWACLLCLRMGRSGRTRRVCRLLVALLFVGFGLFPRAALCVGDGGHLEIELGDEECCDSEDADRPTSVGLPDGSSCPFNCQDAPLGIASALRPGSNAGQHPALAGPMAIASAADGVPRSLTADMVGGRSTQPRAAPPRCLRTAVNLC